MQIVLFCILAVEYSRAPFLYRVQHREWNRKGGIQNDGYHRGPYNGLDDAGNCDRGGRAHAFYNESDLTNCNVEKREK